MMIPVVEWDGIAHRRLLQFVTATLQHGVHDGDCLLNIRPVCELKEITVSAVIDIAIGRLCGRYRNVDRGEARWVIEKDAATRQKRRNDNEESDVAHMSTKKLTRAAPSASDMGQDRHRGVEWSDLLAPSSL